jgi:hypothetical protein
MTSSFVLLWTLEKYEWFGVRREEFKCAVSLNKRVVEIFEEYNQRITIYFCGIVIEEFKYKIVRGEMVRADERERNTTFLRLVSKIC